MCGRRDHGCSRAHPERAPVMPRLGEAALVGIAAGVAGGLAATPIGLTAAGAALAGINGVVSGYLGIYDWRQWRGWVAAVLDSTWGLVGTTLGLALHVINLISPGADYSDELSRRRGRHVYAGGMALRGGFAMAMGNVISNAGGRVGLRGESELVQRRRQFVTDHEELHIWQSRWFGPLFQLIYGIWLVGGVLAGAIMWPVVRGRFFSAVETVAYYDNPFEYWAYRNDGYWPPRGIHPKLAWKPRIR